MHLVSPGSGFSASPRASRWMTGVRGRMNYGRMYVRNEELNCNFEELVRNPGLLGVAKMRMALDSREESGAHPNPGLARGICNRLLADGRFPGKQISAEAQWRLNALISAGGNSAYRLVFGSIAKVGALVRIRICFLPRIPRLRGSLHNSGNCA